MGRRASKRSNDAVEIPLSLTLSPLLRRGEREFVPAVVVPSRCAPVSRQPLIVRPAFHGTLDAEVVRRLFSGGELAEV